MSTNPEEGSRPIVVFVHGLWGTPRSWEHWIERYEGKGYTTRPAVLAERRR
jgi:alpha-beta hydrolase superfamily lysophospholipase